MDGKVVQIVGFGKFEVKHGKARTIPHAPTQSILSIPAKNRIRFQPSEALKERMNDEHEHPNDDDDDDDEHDTKS